MTDATVEPVTGGRGVPVIVSTSFDLASVGYEQRELVVRGSARSFAASAPLTPDGRWEIHESGSAPYATRVVVHRPVDRAGWNGATVVEWLNVSAGFDSAPDWLAAHNTIVQSGAIWIGVSAQGVGVQGGKDAVGGIAAGGLRAADPERYGELHHPGDGYAYDIFAAAGRLARAGWSLDPSAGDRAGLVVAVGESQSAFRLVTYVNGVHPTTPVFDGFLVHSRGGGASPLGEAPGDEILVPDGTIIRTDLDVPMLVFQTETDFTLLDWLAARQPDTERVRVWEVAGSAHADAYTAGIGFDDVGDGRAERRLLDVEAIDGGPLGCGERINAGPAYAVLQAGLAGLLRWCAGGPPLPAAPRLELARTDPVELARDEHGNARGGIRTPLVDVPIATLRGDGNHPEDFCRLFGTTVPFDAATLARLYPEPADFAAAFARSADAAERAGFLRPQEATNLRRAAEAVGVRR